MKKLKQALSLMLIACLLLCTTVSIHAQQSSPAQAYPIVWVKGAFHELYYISETGEQEYAFGSSVLVNGMVGDLGSAGDTLLGYLKKLDFDGMAGRIAEYANEMFAPIKMNPDGSSVNNIDGNLAENQRHLDQAGSEFTFDFDWRQDPVTVAGRLHAYIQEVKRVTNAEKVHVSVRSGSGPVGLAYLAEYLDEGDIAGMFFTASLHNGSTIFGDLATKNFSLNADALIHTNMFQEWNIDKDSLGFWPTLETLHQIGFLAPLLGAVSLLVRKTMVDKLYEDALVPTIFSLPMFWSYVPAAYYEKGIQACFGDKRDEYAGLLARTDYYHYNIQRHSDDIIANAEQEIRIGLLSFFGTAQFFLGPDANTQGDILVGVPESASGASGAQVGKALKYGRGTACLQQNDDGHNHLSPDGTVDASSCILPETTWFVSGIKHFDAADPVILEMSRWFFHAETAPTVFTDTERYPQFMWKEKSSQGYVSIDMPAAEPPELAAGQKLLNALAAFTKCVVEALFCWLK